MAVVLVFVLFGTGVLLALEQITKEGSPRHNALREVDYFSTVSGGGLAAAAYLGSLRDHLAFGGAAEEYSFARAVLDPPEAAGPVERQRIDPKLKAHLERGYANDVISGLFTVAALGTRDRGDLLEQAFDDHILGCQWRRRKLASRRAAGRGSASLTLGDIFVPRSDAGAEVRLPYWVANATVFENGALFPFTPDHLKLYQVHAYRHRCRRRSYEPARETYDSFLAGVPISVALTASGSFPVALPATTLHSRMDRRNPYLHLLDGGMADNLGVLTALRLLAQEPHGRVRRKVLVVIDAHNGELAPFSRRWRSPVVLMTLFRTTVAHLDSWRGRAQEIVRGLCASEQFGPDTKVVFLNFDDLAELTDFGPLLELGLTQADLKKLRANRRFRGVTFAPFTVARGIWTWYDLSEAEQNFLFAVGRYVTGRREAQIREALGW